MENIQIAIISIHLHCKMLIFSFIFVMFLMNRSFHKFPNRSEINDSCYLNILTLGINCGPNPNHSKLHFHKFLEVIQKHENILLKNYRKSFWITRGKISCDFKSFYHKKCNCWSLSNKNWQIWDYIDQIRSMYPIAPNINVFHTLFQFQNSSWIFKWVFTIFESFCFAVRFYCASISVN